MRPSGSPIRSPPPRTTPCVWPDLLRIFVSNCFGKELVNAANFLPREDPVVKHAIRSLTAYWNSILNHIRFRRVPSVVKCNQERTHFMVLPTFDDEFGPTRSAAVSSRPRR